MKDFAAGPGRLRILSQGAKVLYSAFLVATLVGLFVSWRLYGAAVGSAGPRAYYAGEAVSAPAGTSSGSPDANGPSLDLPQEAAAPKPIFEQISDRRLLEATHFHIFTIPVYVLILAHLWLLTRLRPWVHTTGIALAVASSGMHIAGPWLVRGHPSIAVLMPISAIAMLLILAGISVVSGIDMWMAPVPVPLPPRRSQQPSAIPPDDDRRS